MKTKYSTILIGILLSSATLYAEGVPLTPPNAKPGECYAKVVIPAKYETVEEEVIVKESSESIFIIPAKYDTIKEEVLIIPATKKLTPIPADYKESVENVIIRPASKTWKTSLGADALPISPAILSAATSSGVDTQNAGPGECFREYFKPAIYKKVSEEVLIQDEHSEAIVTPPEFEEFEKVITVKPPSKELVAVPAVYEEIEEKVLISPEKTMWKKGQNPAKQVSGATGEIMCLINVPAKYKTIKKNVLKEAATTKVVDVPALTKSMEAKNLISDSQVQYSPVDAIYVTVEKTLLEQEAKFEWHSVKDDISNDLEFSGQQICLVEESAETLEVTKMLLDSKATVKEEEVPATYEMVETQEIIADAKVVKTPIPAEYKTITKKKKVTDEQIGWKRILCQTNMSKAVIASIQTALNNEGYEAGEADGLLGKGTRNAIDQFQRKNNLATGGLTYETLDALKIPLNH